MFLTLSGMVMLVRLLQPSNALSMACASAIEAINNMFFQGIMSPSWYSDIDLWFKKYEFDINRGDYIGVLVDNDKMYYWSVVNDGKLNFNNSNIVGAYRPGFRVITATPVTDEEFKAL